MGLFKDVSADAVRNASLALAKPGTLIERSNYGLRHEGLMEFFHDDDPTVENRISGAARTQYLNRNAACAPGSSFREYLADVRRWRSLGNSWREGKRSDAVFAAWKHAHLFDLALPESFAMPLVSEQILFRINLEQKENQKVITSRSAERSPNTNSGKPPRNNTKTTFDRTSGPEVDPGLRNLLLRENRGEEITAGIWDAAEENRYQKTIQARMAMISEAADCPPVTSKLSRKAFFLYRDTKRLIGPMKDRKMYFVTMAGLDARTRTTRLREKGWIVIWVTSALRMAGGKTGNAAKAVADSPHTHMILIPPLIPRVRRKVGTIVPHSTETTTRSEQMAENRAISAIWRALEPSDGKLDIKILRSKTARLKAALYLAMNYDEPLPGMRGRRFAMPRKAVMRLTPGEKKLLHPRYTRAQMAAWHLAIEITRRRYKYPIHGLRRWVWRRREEITAEALRLGPQLEIYQEIIPEPLREYIDSQFAITATLEDGLEYVLQFDGLHNFNCGGGGMVGLEVSILRLMQPEELATDRRKLSVESNEPWGHPCGWPAILLQLLGIHAEIFGT